MPTPVPPGDSVVLVDGKPDPSASVGPNPANDGLAASGEGWTMRVQGLDPQGQPIELGPRGALTVDAERDVRATGSGFQAGTSVAVYLNPPVGPVPSSRSWWASLVARVATTSPLGSIPVNPDGTFSGTVTLPARVMAGDHVLQAVGTSPASQTMALTVGLVVQPWITLDKGKRTPKGRYDAIRASGDSAGLRPGERLAPFLRIAGKKNFAKGFASIKVRADGTFTWSRKIRPGKGVAVYVARGATESNIVVWRRIR